MKAWNNKAFLIACAVSTLFFGAGSARAADNLQCMLSLRNKASDSIIYAAYLSGNMSQAMREQHGGEMTACVKQNQWSRGAAESAFTVFSGEILIAGVKADFVNKKLPADRLVAWLEAYIKTLPSAKVELLAGGESVESDFGALIGGLLSDKVISENQVTEDTALSIMQYVSIRAGVIFHRERFKTQ